MFEGMITAAARASAPSGWLVCDGTAYNQADYPALYSAIGAAFGDNGAGTFRVPDLRGRSPIGAGQGAGLTNRALASAGGAESHVLETTEIPGHIHQMDLIFGSGSVLGIPLTAQPGGDNGDISTKSTGGGAAHNNMPPWLGVHFFIYAGQ